MLQVHFDHGATEQVSHVAILAPDIRRGLKPMAAIHGLEQFECLPHIVGIEKRQRRPVLGKTFAVGVLGVFLFELGGIEELQLAQFGGGARAIDGAAKAGLHEPRQVADVIDVRVREHDAIDGRSIEGKRLPVAQPQLFEPLEQPAVDEHAAAAGFEQVLRAGDGFGGAVEGELVHGSTAIASLRIVL